MDTSMNLLNDLRMNQSMEYMNGVNPQNFISNQSYFMQHPMNQPQVNININSQN